MWTFCFALDVGRNTCRFCQCGMMLAVGLLFVAFIVSRFHNRVFEGFADFVPVLTLPSEKNDPLEVQRSVGEWLPRISRARSTDAI